MDLLEDIANIGGDTRTSACDSAPVDEGVEEEATRYSRVGRVTLHDQPVSRKWKWDGRGLTRVMFIPTTICCVSAETTEAATRAVAASKQENILEVDSADKVRSEKIGKSEDEADGWGLSVWAQLGRGAARHIYLSGSSQAGEMAHWVTADPFPASPVPAPNRWHTFICRTDRRLRIDRRSCGRSGGLLSHRSVTLPFCPRTGRCARNVAQ